MVVVLISKPSMQTTALCVSPRLTVELPRPGKDSAGFLKSGADSFFWLEPTKIMETMTNWSDRGTYIRR